MAVLAIAQNRVELLLIEVEEERHRIVEAMVLIVAAAVLAMMTLGVVTLTVVFVFSEEYRLAALLTLSLLYLLATLAVIWRLRRHLRNWQSFSASLAEFKKDKACLNEKK